jgi:hypothetical protein
LHAQDGSAVSANIEKPPADCLYRTAEDFVPMTRSERIAEARTAVASTTPFIYSAIRAGIDQGHNRPREWGKDVEGFGLRYGSIYAENFIGQTFQQGVSYALHEDNRYFASGKRNVVRRFGYAIASTLLARYDDGSRSISVSAIGGAATGAFISRAWQPRSTTSAGDAAVSFGLTMATRAGINVLREFSPRFIGRILR